MKARERDRQASLAVEPDVEVTEATDPRVEQFLALLGQQGSRDMAAYDARWRREPFRVLVSRDPLGPVGDDWRWHLSVSRLLNPAEVPPWAAMVAIAHAIRPGVPFVIAVPPRSMWMNVHPGVLHLTEVKDRNLIESWRTQRAGSGPS